MTDRPPASAAAAGPALEGEARDKGRLTPHDVTTATQLAMIVTGGDIDAGTLLDR